MEATEPLAAVTSWGFTHFTHRRDDVTKALRKVRLTWGNYTDYLSNEKSRTYDILYFDPMFTHPVMTSCQFAPIRSQMDHEPLTADSIQKALEKARRVIVKGRSFAELNRQFPQARILGGRYSRVKFAVLEGADMEKVIAIVGPTAVGRQPSVFIWPGHFIQNLYPVMPIRFIVRWILEQLSRHGKNYANIAIILSIF